MEQGNSSTDPSSGNNGNNSDKSNMIVIILGVALAIAVIGLIGLIIIVIAGDSSDSGSDGGTVVVPPPGITIVPTQVVPTPEPGEPTAQVISPSGVNVRTGPGSVYPIINVAPFGAQGQIIGTSQDGTWWVVLVPGAPNSGGWVSAEFVTATNAENVPVIPPPPPPTSVAPPTPTATPAPDVQFTASRTTINAGESTTLEWSVENVKAVYMFPVGASPFDYPVTGQGSREVQPGITTTYELRVINPDDSTSQQRIEITVVNGLTTGRWLLQSYSTQGGLQTPLAGTQITARFEASGNLSGSGGCNTYSGGFTAYDQTLKIGQLSATQALCGAPAGIMEQEAAVLALMGQANSFFISAGQLTVYDSAGNRVLVFISG